MKVHESTRPCGSPPIEENDGGIVGQSSSDHQVGDGGAVDGGHAQVEPKTVARRRKPPPVDWSPRGILKSVGRILTGYDLVVTLPTLESFSLRKLIKCSKSETGDNEGGATPFENLEEEVEVSENANTNVAEEEEIWPYRIPFNVPVFILFISFLEWLFFYYIMTTKLKTFLEYHPFRRLEIWRFYTEILVHGNSHHLWGNLRSQLIVGSCLEIVHGWKRVGLLYMIGVVYGNLSVSIFSPMKASFGASGGVFALITAHLASFTLNWNEMTNPLTRTVLILAYIALQVYVTVVLPLAPGHFQVAHASHFGGAMAGFLVGINILKNFRRREKDIKLGRICHHITILFFFSCVAANIAMQMFLEGFFVDKVTRNHTVTYELCKKIGSTATNLTNVANQRLNISSSIIPF